MYLFKRGGLFVLLAGLFLGCETVLTTSPAPRVNNVVPEVQGTDEHGTALKLSDFRGKVVLLDFWFADCPYCSLEHRDEIGIVQKYKDQPFVLLGVNTDSTREAFQAACREQEMTWHSIWDQTRSIATAWGVQGYPTLFLIDAQGKLREKLTGKQLRAELEKRIEKYLHEVQPTS